MYLNKNTKTLKLPKGVIEINVPSHYRAFQYKGKTIGLPNPERNKDILFMIEKTIKTIDRNNYVPKD